jgi:hypothetical protein
MQGGGAAEKRHFSAAPYEELAAGVSVRQPLTPWYKTELKRNSNECEQTVNKAGAKKGRTGVRPFSACQKDLANKVQPFCEKRPQASFHRLTAPP